MLTVVIEGREGEFTIRTNCRPLKNRHHKRRSMARQGLKRADFDVLSEFGKGREAYCYSTFYKEEYRWVGANNWNATLGPRIGALWLAGYINAFDQGDDTYYRISRCGQARLDSPVGKS